MKDPIGVVRLAFLLCQARDADTSHLHASTIRSQHSMTPAILISVRRKRILYPQVERFCKNGNKCSKEDAPRAEHVDLILDLSFRPTEILGKINSQTGRRVTCPTPTEGLKGGRARPPALKLTSHFPLRPPSRPFRLQAPADRRARACDPCRSAACPDGSQR